MVLLSYLDSIIFLRRSYFELLAEHLTGQALLAKRHVERCVAALNNVESMLTHILHRHNPNTMFDRRLTDDDASLLFSSLTKADTFALHTHLNIY